MNRQPEGKRARFYRKPTLVCKRDGEMGVVGPAADQPSRAHCGDAGLVSATWSLRPHAHSWASAFRAAWAPSSASPAGFFAFRASRIFGSGLT